MRGKNYRIPSGMAYTRKEFAPGAPNCKVARFTLGNPNLGYEAKLELVSKEKAQIRHNALEAARVAVNKRLTALGCTDFYLAVKPYPHIILRENRMIATAGADRLQEGMRRAFGKPNGLASRVANGTIILEVRVKNADIEKAREALKKASSKLPTTTSMAVTSLAVVAQIQPST